MEALATPPAAHWPLVILAELEQLRAHTARAGSAPVWPVQAAVLRWGADPGRPRPACPGDPGLPVG